MMENKILINLIEKSFPIQPIPRNFFWREAISKGDIPEELQKRIANHQWPDITINDWAMIGASPNISRTFMDPEAFLYYLPSLLVGVMSNLSYVHFATEALVPPNKDRQPRGDWWTRFVEKTTHDQRAAVCGFLRHLHTQDWDRIGAQAQQEVIDGEIIWFQHPIDPPPT